MSLNSTPNFMFFAHGGSLNRGCEAIIRSTEKILKNASPKATFSIVSARTEEDQYANLHEVGKLVNFDRRPAWSPAWIAVQAAEKVARRPEWVIPPIYPKVLQAITDCDCAISVGGDVYCYGEPWRYYGMNRLIKRQDKPLILWGASIEASLLTPTKIKDLDAFDIIFVRESLSYAALTQRNIGRKVLLHADPAFNLPTELLPLPSGWLADNMVGLNFSPLILKYEKTKGLAMRALYRLIEHILNTTKMSIALIPHVTHPENNDAIILEPLFRSFQKEGRVIMLPSNLTASQYKGYISRCAMFIGARTHSTIAAYSSLVPTLVIGYSVKARGIARDLFENDDYILPIDSIQSENSMLQSFDHLKGDMVQIRRRLESVIPGFIHSSAQAGHALFDHFS